MGGGGCGAGGVGGGWGGERRGGSSSCCARSSCCAGSPGIMTEPSDLTTVHRRQPEHDEPLWRWAPLPAVVLPLRSVRSPCERVQISPRMVRTQLPYPRRGSWPYSRRRVRWVDAI